MIRGVPVGAQIPTLLMMTKGWPFDVTRTEPTVQVPETQGPLATMGGGKAQPATTYGPAMVTVG
jgi:hypothetical protein